MQDARAGRCIHHVAVAVHDLDAAIAAHAATLGATVALRAALPEQGVEAAALHLPGGGPELELIMPLPNIRSGVARFLERRGEGLHHVAYTVRDVARELTRLREFGVRIIDETPRVGLHGVPVAFVHPAGMYGVLTELVEAGTADATTTTTTTTTGTV